MGFFIFWGRSNGVRDSAGTVNPPRAEGGAEAQELPPRFERVRQGVGRFGFGEGI